MDENIRFENYAIGMFNLSINGIDKLRMQSKHANQFVRKRKQTITDFRYHDDTVEISADF